MLRLHHDGVSAREIGRTLGVARSTIQDNLRRAQAGGIGWPVPAELTDDILEQRLFARDGTKAGLRRRSEPDWGTLARELKRAGVSLMVLWEEYRETQPDGYGYSRFCDLFREFERRLSPVMRQHHVAGDKVFVDYSGHTMEVIDGLTGEVFTAQVFVAVKNVFQIEARHGRQEHVRWLVSMAQFMNAIVARLVFAVGFVVADDGGQVH